MTNKPASATLLPPAGVDLFAIDGKTTETFEKLSSDWRFARVDLWSTTGGLKAAIERYSEHASPSIVIIEAENVDENFVDQLDELASLCAEGTAAVIVGETNDVQLYRRLVGMGVSDYLVRPVKADDLIDVIARTLIDKIGMTESRLMAVIGSKGGVGTSTVAQIMATNFAETLGQKTLLIDASAGWGSHGISFNVDNNGTFAEALASAHDGDHENLNRLVTKVGKKLSLLATGGDPLLSGMEDSPAFEAMLDHFMKEYPFVVVDLSRAGWNAKQLSLSKAHAIVMVTTPLLPALRNTRLLLTELKQMRDSTNQVDLVVNMQGIAKKLEADKTDIEAALDKEPDVMVPFDPATFNGAEGVEKPVFEYGDGKRISELLLPIARSVVVGAGGNVDKVPAANDGGKGGGKLSSLLGMFGGKSGAGG